jgi:putative phosphoesterase
MNRSNEVRVAIVSDIHGNLTAFKAVLADIGHHSPDLVLHGGDLADAGSSPVEIVDLIRGLAWPGVMGNTDEMLVQPGSLEAFAAQSSAPAALWSTIRQIASSTRSALGEERLAWLSELPLARTQVNLSLVHATPQSCWRTPSIEATDAELERVYGSLGQEIVVFGHTHRPFVRGVAKQPRLLINTGSVGLSYDGDPRASYLVLTDGVPSIRRVEYNVEKELKALASCDLPGAAWTAKILRNSSPQMP